MTELDFHVEIQRYKFGVKTKEGRKGTISKSERFWFVESFNLSGKRSDLPTRVETYFVELFNYADKLFVLDKLEHTVIRTVHTNTLALAVTRLIDSERDETTLVFTDLIKPRVRITSDDSGVKLAMEPISKAMGGLSDAMTHGIDAMIMAGRTLGKSAHLFPPSFADVDLGVDKSAVMSVRGGTEPMKELKVSPLAERSSMFEKVFGAGAFDGKVELTPETLEALKKFGIK